MMNGQTVKIKVGSDFDPIPMDKYTCQIVDVNLVKQFNQFKGEEQEVLNYQFSVLDNKPMPAKTAKGEELTTRGRFLWRRCTPSLSEKSWLLKLAKAAYGRDLTKEEMENFNPENLVNKQVDVMVEQVPSKDATTIYNNIVAFSKTIKPLEAFINTNTDNVADVEKSTSPVVAPDVKKSEDPDDFIKGLEAESKKAKEAKE